MKKIGCVILLTLLVKGISAQKIEILSDSVNASLRGLSVVDDNIVWVSGSSGTVGKSLDAGKSWTWITVKGFEKTEFRDIEAFDKNTAVIMGITEPAQILRTEDGGQTWKVVFKDGSKGMFLDAMDFWNSQNGIVIGDPLNGHFFIAKTFDGGKTWSELPQKNQPMADSGEACFASSGTNIRMLNKTKAIFASGGLSAHVFIHDKKISIPILQGKESTGANSIAVNDKKTMIVVGGDFMKKDDTEKNCVITTDGGATWVSPKTSPTGYRSCVEYLAKNKWITCGLNGVDISNNNGINWNNISEQSFHVCRKAKKGNAVYFAGNRGRVGKLIIQ
jgi:photosystem II stability/assembly factor-like uncharacterized protein